MYYRPVKSTVTGVEDELGRIVQREMTGVQSPLVECLQHSSSTAACSVSPTATIVGDYTTNEFIV